MKYEYYALDICRFIGYDVGTAAQGTLSALLDKDSYKHIHASFHCFRLKS